MPVTIADNGPKILGIDPGLKGALAFLSIHGELREIEDMPIVGNEVNAHLLSLLITGYGPVHTAVVERAQSMPKQGIAGAFNYGVGYGKILGVLAALEIPTVHQPSSWKTKAKLGKDKNLSRQRACERWPGHAQYFKLAKDDGRAEAALMAAMWLEENPVPRLRRRAIRPLHPI